MPPVRKAFACGMSVAFRCCIKKTKNPFCSYSAERIFIDEEGEKNALDPFPVYAGNAVGDYRTFGRLRHLPRGQYDQDPDQICGGVSGGRTVRSRLERAGRGAGGYLKLRDDAGGTVASAADAFGAVVRRCLRLAFFSVEGREKKLFCAGRDMPCAAGPHRYFSDHPRFGSCGILSVVRGRGRHPLTRHGLKGGASGSGACGGVYIPAFVPQNSAKKRAISIEPDRDTWGE